MKLMLTKKEAFGRTAIRPGKSVIGEGFLYTPESENRTEITSLNVPVVGKRLYVGNNIFNFIVTSDISEVMERDDNRIIFKTQTSIYELEVYNEV